MTRNCSLPTSDTCLRLRFAIGVAVILSGFCIQRPLAAQVQPQTDARHYLYDYGMPPGMVGHRKLLARQEMQGYFQPVRMIGPENARIDIFSAGHFQGGQPQATTAGLLVGHIYRLKITNIPGHPGRELYPSVEIIGRLFPPAGQAVRFAIPVSIPLRDIEPALSGRLVTRVVYLENPRTAIAEQRDPDDQPFFDVGLQEDPLRVAEKFGRPMIIVRLGSRIPDHQELNGFGFGTPPIRWFESATAGPESSGDEASLPQRTTVQQVAWQDPAPVNAATPSPPVTSPAVLPAVATGPASWSLNDQSDQNANPLADAPSRTSPALPGNPPQATGPVVCPVVPYGVADPFAGVSQMCLQPWPDELLIDGGDRNLQSLVRDTGDQREVRGLDTEDTIGHFDTLDGRTLVDASNRVAIYAPRFSAVRKIDGVGRTQYNQLLGRVDDEVLAVASQRTDFSSTTLQNLQPNRHRRAMQPSGIENRTGSVLHGNRTQINQYDGRFRTYENLRMIKAGIYDGREKGRLAIAIDRASTWNSDVSAQSADRDMKLIVVGDVRQAQETVHVKTEFNRPQLRLVKVASTSVALPGDEVEFTIRFDNVGDQPIGNITILDNLTGRLDYIEDSSECSVDGVFASRPNKAGSKTLRWEITDPLRVNQGGVIRFRCRVR